MFNSLRRQTPSLLVLSVVACLASCVVPPREEPPSLSITVTGNANVRTGPGFGYEVRFMAEAGTRATAVARDETSNWLLIRHATRTGWLFAPLTDIEKTVLQALPDYTTGQAQPPDAPSADVPEPTPTATAQPAPDPDLDTAADDGPVTVAAQAADLHTGPDVLHPVLGQFLAGTQLKVLAITPDRAWLKITSMHGPAWVRAELTSANAERRAALPVAEPVAPLGQTYHSPGTYDRDRHPGLAYDFEIVWSRDERNGAWEWSLDDPEGFYDGLRVYLGNMPERRGMREARISLEIPYVEADLISYDMRHHEKGLWYQHLAVSHGRADMYELARAWPEWEDWELPAGFAWVESWCTYQEGPDDVGARDYAFCSIHVMWGASGSVELNTMVTEGIAEGLRVVLSWQDADQSWLDHDPIVGRPYLWPVWEFNQWPSYSFDGPGLRVTRANQEGDG